MKYAVIDIETTGLNRYTDEITWVGIGLYEELFEPMVRGYWYDMSNPKNLPKLRGIVNKLKRNGLRVVWQNGKFDTLFLELHYKIKLPISEDCMLMGTAYDLAAEHALKKMAQRYLGVSNWDINKKDKLSGKKETVLPYLKKDVQYTWELFCFFKENMSAIHRKIYTKMLRPAYRMYRNVERRGIYINRKKLAEVKEKYRVIEKKKLSVLNKLYSINWNSPQQKQEVLFSLEKLPILKLSPKTGKPSADAKVLKRLAAQGHKLPQKMLDYSAANTLNKMFLNRWEEDSAYDGRIHPSFNLTNVVTGRTSCSNPNLQQVPRNKDIRTLYTAPKKRVFFEADYSQLELRIAADYANEPTMIKIYENDGDIHTETARIMTGGREPTKDERNKAKAINFGFLYGMMAKGFVDYAYDSYGVVFKLPEAQHNREMFFMKYSRLLPWHKEMAELCESLGGVSNMFGQFRSLPLIYSDQRFERLSAARRAINSPVQGTGSCILVGAATQVDKELLSEGVTVCGTIHDAIVGEVWEEDVEWFIPEIKRIMARPKIMDEFGVELKIKLDTDVAIGPWGTH